MDLSKALELYTKSAEQGNPNAQFNLANMYLRGAGTEINNEEAAKWNKKAAEQGHPLAMCNLGAAYDGGYGVEKDYDEAFKPKMTQQVALDSENPWKQRISLCFYSEFD